MAEIQPADRFQQSMFSSLDEQVDSDSIVRIIDIIVDKLYKAKQEAKQSEVGRPEYPRGALLKLYIYGYINRIKSSRRLEKECRRNLEVIWLLGRMQPDHWTISNFRKENQEEIKRVIKAFTRFLTESGYLEGKSVVIDGTKIKANASLSDYIGLKEIKDRLNDIDSKVVYYLDTMEEDENKTDEIEKLRKEKEELLKQIDKLKSEKKNVYIKTDSDANIMKSKGGRLAGYNIQISCDEKNKLIVATDVSSQVNDFKQLKNMYEKSKEMLGGSKPKEITADAGYYSIEEIQEIDDEVRTYVASLPKQAKGEFTYDNQMDEYTCGQGKRLTFLAERNNRRGVRVRDYRCNECNGCPVRGQCTSSSNGRMKTRYVNQDFRDSYSARMQEKSAKKKIIMRKAIVEHPFGTIKLWLGRNPLLLRGREKVHTEIRLVSMSYNLLRVFNIDGFNNLMEKVNKLNWAIA